MFLFCISNQISLFYETKTKYVEKGTRGGIFFKPDYHEMLFFLAGQHGKTEITNILRRSKVISWKIEFYSQFVIIVIFKTKSNLNFFPTSKAFALRLVGKEDFYPFIKIDIRCVHLWFLNKCSRWDSVWWDGSRRGEAGTIFQHWRISFPGFYSCIEISELENILSQKK